MRRPRLVRLAAAPLAAVTVLALVACGDDGGDDGSAAASTASRTEDGDLEKQRTTEYHEANNAAYGVAVDLWEKKESFPTTDAAFERLVKEVAAGLPGQLTVPGADEWEVVAYRGDYGGNKGLLACTPGVVTQRMAVPADGASIGFGIADGDVSSVIIYDPAKIDADEGFDDQGFYAQITECATDDTEMDGEQKASERGTF